MCTPEHTAMSIITPISQKWLKGQLTDKTAIDTIIIALYSLDYFDINMEEPS